MKNVPGIFPILCVLFSITGCENYVDKYKVNVGSLLTLPDGFYAYRRERIYVENGKFPGNYRTWYNLTEAGDVQSIFSIKDLKETVPQIDGDNRACIHKYRIDTVADKVFTQRFVNLSRKFKFGHIGIDRRKEIFFSYKKGLPVEYLMALNDSVKDAYLHNKDFRLLKNGWFENKRE